jgi:hypothetical protein
VTPRARAAVALATLGLLSITAIAYADVEFGTFDVPTMFFIDKSDDRNRVDYGIRLDAQCHPVGGNPVVVYWREFENGRRGRATHGLNIFEGPVYGVGSSRVVETHDGGATLDVTIRAISSRRLRVHTQAGSGSCDAWVTTAISGIDARLDRVHLTLGDGPGSLRFVDIYGSVLGAEPRAVTEHVVR